VRAAVLAATLDELVERGYAAMTVQGVAARAGVHKTSLYRRWSSKGALLADALLATSAPAPPAPDTGALRTDLFGLWRTVPPGRGGPDRTVAISRALAAAAADPDVAAVHALLWQRRLDLVTTAVDRAVARGELPPGADPELLLDLLVGPFQTRVISRGRAPDTTFLLRVLEAAVHAVGASPPAPRPRS
jgi:AcrR family transcriptional regulator